jgi:nucleotide-binding universal stress UspA family protein
MYKRILVPLDGSTLAEQALPHALNIAQGEDSALNLVRVALDQPFLASKGGGEVYPDEILIQDRAAAGSYLEGVQADVQAKGASASTQVLAGPVAECIVDYAKEHQIDLIVMSTHGRSGPSRWVNGSVAEKVLHGSHCPVLIVHGLN